jgi:hypothetical protein
VLLFNFSKFSLVNPSVIILGGVDEIIIEAIPVGFSSLLKREKKFITFILLCFTLFVNLIINTYLFIFLILFIYHYNIFYVIFVYEKKYFP